VVLIQVVLVDDNDERAEDSAELRKLVEGIVTVPNFLHNPKHLGERSLKNEWHLINFYVRLLVELLIYVRSRTYENG
jgi:hypothetical protein